MHLAAQGLVFKKGIKKFGIKDGLPQIQITSLYKDSKGFIWVGTRHGVARWDGKEIKPFVIPNNEKYCSQEVEAIKEFEDNSIFVLYYTRNFNVSFSIISGNNAKYFNFNLDSNYNKNVKCKVRVINKSIVSFLFIKDNILYEYEYNRWSNKINLKFKLDSVLDIHKVEKNYFIVSRRIVNKSNKLFECYKNNLKVDSKVIINDVMPVYDRLYSDIYQSFGNIFYHTQSNFLYSLKFDSVIYLDSIRINIDNRKIERFFISENGLIIQTMDGVYIQLNKNLYKIEINDISRDFVFDNEDNLYVGTEHGLNCLYNTGIEEGIIKNNQEFDYIIYINKVKDTFIYSSISLGILKQKGSKVEYLKIPGIKKMLVYGNVIYNKYGDIFFPIFEDSKIPIYTNRKFKLYDFKYPGVSYGAKLNPVTNDIFISKGSNFVKFNSISKKITRINNDSFLANKIVYDFDFLKNGNLVLKSDRFFYIAKDDKVLLKKSLPAMGWSLFVDSNQSIWQSVGKKICVYRNHKIFWLKDFPSKTLVISISQIKNFLIIGTLHEIIFLNLDLWYKKGIEDYITYSVDNHLNIKEGNSNSFFIENDSIFYWPCLDKVLKININKIAKLNNIKPKVSILEYVFYNEDKRINVYDTFLQKEYLIPSYIRNFEVKFSCPSFLNHNNLKYRYRLNNNSSWVLINNNEYIRIVDIYKGTYQIEIQASYDGINWGESVKSLPIVFQPRFYETFMFWAFLLVFLTFLGFLVINFFLNRLLKLQKEELKKKKEKNSLSLQVIKSKYIPHFTFNAMTSINYLLRKEEIKKASAYLIKMTDLQRIALSNFDNPETMLETELKFLSHYLSLEGLRFEDTLTYKISVGKNVDMSLMVPNLSIHTMVENAIKHGLYNKPDGNWKLSVYVIQLKNKLIISVEDNGLGLEKANENKTHSTGSGLKMLKKQLKILSNESKQYTYRLSDIYDSKGQIRGARSSIFITSY